MGAVAAASLAITGALVPMGAVAEENDGSLEALVSATFQANEDVQVVGQNANGQIVVLTTDPSQPIEGPLAGADVITQTLDAPLVGYSQDDVVGGAGYFISAPGASSGGLCSVGFSGWTPQGDPAVITAGHCTDDGAATDAIRTLPSGDTAGGGAANGDDLAPLSPLGVLGFSQYGGPGNSAGADGDIQSVDIAAIDVTNSDSNLLPEVSTWSSEAIAAEDLSLDTTLVTSTGTAQIGAIAKSGRTTGYTTGEVNIVNGWAQVSNPSDPSDVRFVYGFGAFLESDSGDSGGAMVQGETAVGVLSGGGFLDGRPFTWGADLNAGLALTDGYSVALHIDAPVLTTPPDGGSIGTGSTISGTGVAGTTLVVTPATGDEFEVAINDQGNWSFPAPDQLGDFEFSIKSVRGFDESASNSYALEILAAAPVFTSPANGDQIVGELTEITGTGAAGGVIELTGSVTDEVEVDADGNWSVAVDFGPGAYSVAATQTVAGEASGEASVDFTVVPAAPVITSPGQGEVFAHDAGPSSATGTGLAGASIAVTWEGAPLSETTVGENGEWVADFAPALETGEYTLEVTQTAGGQTSAVATVSFVVDAAPVVEPTPDPSNPGDDLANTGGTGASPLLAGGAALALLVGAGLLAASRFRRANSLS